MDAGPLNKADGLQHSRLQTPRKSKHPLICERKHSHNQIYHENTPI